MLEIRKLHEQDNFTYTDDKPTANSVVFEDGNSVTIRAGFEILGTDLIRYQTDTAQTPMGWLCHVSTQDNEYVFNFANPVMGGSIYHFKDGKTNEHVYIFDGMQGAVMEVDYKYVLEAPAGGTIPANTNTIMMEQYGDLLLGVIEVANWVANKSLGTMYITKSSKRPTGNLIRNYVVTAPPSNPADLITYRKDQPQPFTPYVANDGTNNMAQTFSSDFVGGSWSYFINASNAVKSIKYMIGHWL